ncbi:hypothetical protein [Salibacter halophilus]|uniref:Uncharacterized protein n=1 Tax=Salibacter halophilus TaxID=1803916 RepID=A0A6N6M294_9FLAO|nr:hypothetical protein [Salibacter halophilus]KAB1062834.1 hypothetical protein F3059_11650 [Salibacter halophilus]
MNKVYLQILSIVVLAFLSSCEKTGDRNENKYPETKIAFESIDLSGDDRLSSSVRLSWFGTDSDGYITGFEISIDDGEWQYTNAQDSTFKFSIPAGSDSADIEFAVRAIDNDDNIDQSPAILSVPIKNSTPIATIDNSTIKGDSTLVVLSFDWEGTDPDGFETLEKAYIKANNGSWSELDFSQGTNLISVVPSQPDQQGQQSADIYIGQEDSPNATIDGFINGDSNTFYIKVADIAGKESEPDTSNTVFFRDINSDLLMVTGQPETVTDQYRSILNNVYPNYNIYNISQNTRLPRYFNPTFKLLIQQFDKVFFNTDSQIFTNLNNQQEGLLLNFATPSLLEFTNDGGKLFITTSFTSGQDLSAIAGVLPFEELSTGPGSADLYPDSTVYSNDSNYPNLKSGSVVFSMDPVVPTADAEPFYFANFNNYQNWSDNVIGIKRTGANNNVNQILFAVELYTLSGNQQNLENLFDTILNDEFDW